MGKIPEFQQRLRQDFSDAGRIQGAGAIGRGISQLAESGARTLQIREARLEREQRIAEAEKEREDRVQAKIYANEAANDLKEKMRDKTSEWQESNKDEPVDAAKKLQSDLDNWEYLDQLKQKAPNDIAKRQIEMMIDNVKTNHVIAAKDWERKALVQKAGRVVKSGIEGLQDDSFEQGFQGVEFNLKSVEATASTLKDVTNKEVYEETLKEGKSSVLMKAYESEMINGNLELAKQMLEKEDHREILGSDNVAKIKKSIAASEKSRRVKIENLEKKKFTNSYEWLDKARGEPVDPVNFATDALGNFVIAPDFEQKMIDRTLYIEEKNKKHGLDLPLLTDQEYDQIKALANRGTVDERAINMASLSSQMPPEARNLFGKQFFSKDPAGAAAFGLSEIDPNTSKEILIGKELIDSKTTGYSSDNIKKMFLEKVGDAIPNVSFKENLGAAANALYHKMAQEQGIVSDDIDSLTDKSTELMDAVLEKLIGPKASIREKETFTFRIEGNKFLEGEDFEEVVGDLDLERITKTHDKTPKDINGNDLDFEDFEEYGYLEVVGDGLYHMIIDRGSGELTLVDGTKNKTTGQPNPFVLDMKKIVDKYGVPDSFVESMFKRAVPEANAEELD